MFKQLICTVIVCMLTGCGGGYRPPEELVEPDSSICFKEGIIDSKKGGKLAIDMKECGSLRWSEIIFEENSISQDATFRLSVGEKLIEPPSFMINYAVKLELIAPEGTGITGGVHSNVPFVSSLLSDNGYATIDVSAFYKKMEEPSALLPQSSSQKDDELKKIKTLIGSPGQIQPGVVINGAMLIGDKKIIDFNNSEGSYIFNAEPNQKFTIMLSPIPLLNLFDDIGASSSLSSYSIEASQEALLDSDRIIKENSKSFFKTDSAEIPSAVLDAALRGKLKRKLSRNIKDKLLLKGSKKINFDDGLTEGKKATGIYVWDYSGCFPGFFPGCDNLLEDQEAVIHKVTDHGIILVHDHAGSYASLSLSQIEAIDDLAETFEQSIFPRDIQFFGDPSDVDGNDRIVIFVTDTLDGTGILGFFYSVDLFENDGLPQNLGGFGDSNEADMIYVTTPSDSVHKLLLQSIVAHEFQHLINFNNKTLKKYISSPGVPLDSNLLGIDAPLEDVFINEGLSHFAEDVVGLADVKAGISHILNHPNESFKPYLKNNWRTSLTDSAGGGSFAMRGQNYLLVRYLFEQAGGATPVGDSEVYHDDGGIAFIRALVSSDSTGLANIANTFYEHDALKRNFTNAYLDWLVALYNDKYDGTISSDERFNFKPEYKDKINVNQTVGISLNTSRVLEDTGETVALDGPSVFRFEDKQTYFASTLANLSATFVEYKLNAAPSKETLRFAIRGESFANIKGLIFRAE